METLFPTDKAACAELLNSLLEETGDGFDRKVLHYVPCTIHEVKGAPVQGYNECKRGRLVVTLDDYPVHAVSTLDFDPKADNVTSTKGYVVSHTIGGALDIAVIYRWAGESFYTVLRFNYEDIVYEDIDQEFAPGEEPDEGESCYAEPGVPHEHGLVRYFPSGAEVCFSQRDPTVYRNKIDPDYFGLFGEQIAILLVHEINDSAFPVPAMRMTKTGPMNANAPDMLLNYYSADTDKCMIRESITRLAEFDGGIRAAYSQNKDVCKCDSCSLLKAMVKQARNAVLNDVAVLKTYYGVVLSSGDEALRDKSAWEHAFKSGEWQAGFAEVNESAFLIATNSQGIGDTAVYHREYHRLYSRIYADARRRGKWLIADPNI